MRRVSWLIVMALVGVMGFAGAAFAQLSDTTDPITVTVDVEAGSQIGFAMNSSPLGFVVSLPGEAGGPFVFEPPLNDDGVSVQDLPKLFWNVLLAHGKKDAEINVSIVNGNLIGGGTNPGEAVDIYLRVGDLGCLSEDEILQECGNQVDSVDLIYLYENAGAATPSAKLVELIPNSYTGADADFGLELWLEFSVINWDLLRAGELSADIVFDIRQNDI